MHENRSTKDVKDCEKRGQHSTDDTTHMGLGWLTSSQFVNDNQGLLSGSLGIMHSSV